MATHARKIVVSVPAEDRAEAATLCCQFDASHDTKEDHVTEPETQVCLPGPTTGSVQCTLNNASTPEQVRLLKADGAVRELAPQAQPETSDKIVRNNPITDTVYYRYANTAIGHAETPAVEFERHKTVISRHQQFVAILRGDHLPVARPTTLVEKMVAEMVGTAMIVLFGCGSVATAVLSGAQAGIWQVAVVWGITIAAAIHSTASVSGAHLNPAISLAFAVVRPDDFALKDLLPYWIAQLLGAILGGAINLAIWNGPLRDYEEVHNFTRGDESSVLTAACFGEYFPNPGFQYNAGSTLGMDPLNGGLGWDRKTISPFGAMMVEAWGTAVLAFVIFALTESRNKTLVRKEMVPLLIGLTVSVLISVYAPLTQAGWNPARDLGPRMVAAMAGWGKIAIPGPRNGFWVYIAGPLLGAPLGAALHDFLVARGIRAVTADSVLADVHSHAQLKRQAAEEDRPQTKGAALHPL